MLGDVNPHSSPTPGQPRGAASAGPQADLHHTDHGQDDWPAIVGDSAPMPLDPTPHPAVSGPTIGHVGRYALKQLIGEGGLGRVYTAWDPLLSRTLAIKTLHMGSEDEQRQALDALILDEARASASLSHPNIVTVYDAGLSEMGVYIAMEHLAGSDLRQLMDDGWRPDPMRAAKVMRRVAEALSYAHGRGVIHCDIKPANIFMTDRRKPKVLDFGIARVAHRGTSSLDGLVTGSPLYLAPEQLRGETPDVRTDVYAMGVVLYELLTGRKPFAGRNLDEIVQAVQKGDPVPARELCPGVPPDLSAIAARAMAVDPERRFANAREMAVALRAWQIRATAPMRLTPAFDPSRQPYERGEPASAGDSRVPATTARWLALLGLAVAGALLWQLR